MTSPEDPSSQKLEPSVQSAAPELSRRGFVLGGAVLFATVLFAGEKSLHFIHNEHITSDVVDRFNDGVTNEWDELAVFPGMLNLTAATLHGDMFLGNDASQFYSNKKIPANKSLLALRPIFVKQTLLANARNGSIDSPQTRDRLETVAGKVSDGTVGFWLPGTQEMAFVDAQANGGNVLAITRYHGTPYTIRGKENPLLEREQIKLDGREASAGLIYPYIEAVNAVQRNDPNYSDAPYDIGDYKFEPRQKFVGHSLYVDNDAQMNDIVLGFTTDFEYEPPVLYTYGN